MRLALIAFNPTVGDLAANARRMLDWAARADEAGADLVVFPELALCGYPPKDLLLQGGFVRDCSDAARDVFTRAPRGVTLVFGCPLPARDPLSPGFDAEQPSTSGGVCNSLIAARNGKMLDYYDKRLLPTYDVFDEDRYFVAGDRAVVIDVSSRANPAASPVRVGLSVCEDLWRGEDVGFASRYFDKPDPVAELVAAGASVIVNPSASPFVLGKGRRHRDLLASHARRHSVTVAAVNQIGANDELVFDGHPCVFGPSGNLLAAGVGFEESMLTLDLNENGEDGLARSYVADPLLDTDEAALLYRALVLGVRDYCRKTGFKQVVLGLSGGIDSAVTAVLAAAALGPRNVLGVALPATFSSQGSIDDARSLAQRLAIDFDIIPIQTGVDALQSCVQPVFDNAGASGFSVAEENLQSRVRGTLLMALSNKLGRLLLTTGNKSELAVGYCTLYGDMNGGLAVLSDISKQWVYRLARWINAQPTPDLLALAPVESADRHLPTAAPIPESSITKPPSAELRPNQKDQDSLPPYDLLDRIIECYVERRMDARTIAAALARESFSGVLPESIPATVARMVRLIDGAEFKRKQAAIGLKVTGVAFGSGRRVPIAQRYRVV